MFDGPLESDSVDLSSSSANTIEYIDPSVGSDGVIVTDDNIFPEPEVDVEMVNAFIPSATEDLGIF